MAQPSSETTLEARATLPADVPLHARPAGLLAREAARFEAQVTVGANGKRANAKSILEVLALGVAAGAEVVIEASGDDAAEAADHLATVIAGLR